jgi:hypothetical protein
MNFCIFFLFPSSVVFSIKWAVSSHFGNEHLVEEEIVDGVHHLKAIVFSQFFKFLEIRQKKIEILQSSSQIYPSWEN